ncbi:MAG: putative surface protein with fasciclin (FAS1) repeats, partial [Flavobacteriales bacterium]
MNKNLLITSLRKLALSAVLAFTVIGLRAQSVYDFIAASPDHTSLTAAIDAAGLAATLSGPGEFTVFAPTDAAFDAALAELGVTLGDLAADVPALTGILLYHVVDGIVLSSELMNGMTPTPLNDANTIKVTVTGGSEVFVNQAEVTGADNETGNGVVHVTDGVILATETVVDVALSTGVHTSLVAAVTAAELLPALTNPFAELTVFAPTDDAFTAALAELGVTLGDLAADIPALQAILTYHVVNGTVLSSELTNGMTPTPLNDANTIKVTVTGGSEVFVNQAQVTAPDNSTGNGVVHVTDGVILATETVVDVALSTGVHTSLVAAVIAAELLPALTNPFAELTVFAPTDDAFTAALTELGVTLGDLAADIPALQAILTYHVVDGTVLSSDLTNGMTPTPLNAANTIKVTVGGSGVFVNQAEVTGADNETGNGVVHVTDGVILATETVVDVALSTGVHTSLVAAVIAAELLPALTNPFAELTVFAPTDDAFTAALTELGVTLGDLAADIPALQAILTYHVVDGTVLSSDLTNG